MQIQEIIKLDIVQNFIRSLVQLELHMLGENEAIKAVTPHVKMLCEDPVWSCLDVPSCKKETIYLLYAGDDTNLMIFIGAWPSDGKNNHIHDHDTWSVIGSLVGHEINHIWRRVDDCTKPSYCELEYIEKVDLIPGSVYSQSCSAIHSIENPAPDEGVAISLHVYGKDLRSTRRYIYLPEEKTAYLNPNDEFNSIEDN